MHRSVSIPDLSGAGLRRWRALSLLLVAGLLWCVGTARAAVEPAAGSEWPWLQAAVSEWPGAERVEPAAAAHDACMPPRVLLLQADLVAGEVADIAAAPGPRVDLSIRPLRPSLLRPQGRAQADVQPQLRPPA